MKVLEAIFAILGFFTLVAVALLLTATWQPTMFWKYGMSDKPILHTTISSDGQMVATLLNAGTDKQLLRVRHLDTDSKWREIKAPPFTHSIRFGLTRHELLVTHLVVEPVRIDRLSKVDLDKPENGFQTLYEAENLAFPVEVKPGQVMVRTKLPPKKGGKSYLSDFYWILVGPDKQIQKVGPDHVLPYPAPNIVGNGFFWIEDKVGITDKEQHPLIHAYALPNGLIPAIDRERLKKNTFNFDCDYNGNRCLRTFITNVGEGREFIYDIDTFLGNQHCAIKGVKGSSDGLQVTPDGLAAVMSIAPGFDKVRHVAVIRFNQHLCEAVSVQHIQFEE